MTELVLAFTALTFSVLLSNNLVLKRRMDQLSKAGNYALNVTFWFCLGGSFLLPAVASYVAITSCDLNWVERAFLALVAVTSTAVFIGIIFVRRNIADISVLQTIDTEQEKELGA